MSTTPPVAALATTAAAIAITALTVVPLGAVAAPCDTRDGAVEYLEPPFSAEQIRAAMPKGLEIVVRTESAIAGNFSRRLRVEQATGDTATLLESTVEEAFRQQLPDSTVDASWAQLRDHSCFPADATQRARTTAHTPFGELAAWRYQFEQDALLLVLTFADELPGLPVHYERFESGILVFSSRQTQRSDRTRVQN